MFQPTHNSPQRSYKLVGGGWRVPVASLCHSPSLFIQLAVVTKERKTFSASDLSELCPLPATDSLGTSRPGESHKHLCLLPMPETSHQAGWDENTDHFCMMLPILPEVFDGINFFLKCNSLLLHVLQESVSAELLTHSSWNMCKLILAAALRGYSPPSSTAVRFSRRAVQHTSNKSGRNWLCGS